MSGSSTTSPELAADAAPATTAPSRPLGQDLRRIWGLIRPERWVYAQGFGALLVVNLIEIVGPLLIAIAVDLVALRFGAPGGRVPQIFQLAGVSAADFSLPTALGLYLVLQLVANVCRYPMLMRISIPSHRIGQGLRNAIVAQLLRLSRPFFDRSKSGDLMSLATADVMAVRMMLGPGVLLMVDTLLLLVFVLAVMVLLSWPLTVAALLPLPLIGIFTHRFSHLEFDRFEAVQDDLAKLTERAREAFAGIRIVQGYARGDHYGDRFRAHSRRHLGLNLRLARVRALFDPTLDFFLGLSTVLVLGVGGIEMAQGRMGVGTFVAFLYLVAHLSGPMVGFGWAVSVVQRGRASLKRIDALLAEPVEIEDAADARPADGPGSLSVRGLTFRYPGAGRPALEEIAFELPPGRTLGIVGPVGCGKTTLASLLVRLYDPPPGTIQLDGVDIRELQQASLRTAVVLAPQDTFLFGDTVRSNILMARPEGTDDEQAAAARELARLAAIDDEVKALPQGDRTLLGERGHSVSGGQRQRLAIARAIGADPRVLILDDCLSAVDARTEEAILAHLGEVFAGRSGIVISHRVRAVERCDEILVLEEGRIAARGTHAELLAAGGSYAEIAREQSREEGR